MHGTVRSRYLPLIATTVLLMLEACGSASSETKPKRQVSATAPMEQCPKWLAGPYGDPAHDIEVALKRGDARPVAIDLDGVGMLNTEVDPQQHPEFEKYLNSKGARVIKRLRDDGTGSQCDDLDLAGREAGFRYVEVYNRLLLKHLKLNAG